MVITDSTSPSKTEIRGRRCAWQVGAVLVAACGITSAQGVDFSGNIRAGASNTDNIFLQPAPDDTDETIYRASTALNLDYENQRVNTSVRYQFNWFRYSDADTTNRFHRYDARLTGDLVPETLFLEVGGSRSQSLRDPDDVLPSGRLPLSNNLADRDDYYVEPRFEQTFGGSITVNARYRLTEVRFDESDFDETQSVQDNTNESARFRADNYRRERGITWALGYDWRETEYDESQPWEFNQATAELGLWLSGKMRVFASGGLESAWDDPVDRSPEDEFWEAGFAYRNGDRLSAEFAAGERSFGSSWRGQLDFSFRRGTLTFIYAEQPTTDGVNRFNRGNLLDPEEPNDFLTRPGGAERYVSERGQARLNLAFRRTDVGIVIYDETRTGRFRADGTPLADGSQNGISVSASWQAGARTSLTARGSFNNRENENGGEQDFISATVGVDYRLGRAMGLLITYNYSEQDPSRESGGRDYVANVVSVFLSYSF